MKKPDSSTIARQAISVGGSPENMIDTEGGGETVFPRLGVGAETILNNRIVESIIVQTIAELSRRFFSTKRAYVLLLVHTDRRRGTKTLLGGPYGQKAT